MKLNWGVIGVLILLFVSLGMTGCSTSENEGNPVVSAPDPLIHIWNLESRSRNGADVPIDGSESLTFYQNETGRCAGANALNDQFYLSNYFRWEKVAPNELMIYNNSIELLGVEILVGHVEYSISGNRLTLTQIPLDGAQPTDFDNEVTVWRR